MYDFSFNRDFLLKKQQHYFVSTNHVTLGIFSQVKIILLYFSFHTHINNLLKNIPYIKTIIYCFLFLLACPLVWGWFNILSFLDLMVIFTDLMRAPRTSKMVSTMVMLFLSISPNLSQPNIVMPYKKWKKRKNTLRRPPPTLLK